MLICRNAHERPKTRAKMKKLMLFITFAVIATSCGSTRVSVDKPAQGTTTTITVTTNNPISTEVNPTVEMKNEKQ